MPLEIPAELRDRPLLSCKVMGWELNVGPVFMGLKLLIHRESLFNRLHQNEAVHSDRDTFQLVVKSHPESDAHLDFSSVCVISS